MKHAYLDDLHDLFCGFAPITTRAMLGAALRKRKRKRDAVNGRAGARSGPSRPPDSDPWLR